jgi:hypothetical protein
MKTTECVTGAQLKLNIHIDPLGSLHMSDYDFECNFFVFQKKQITITKSEMAKIDDDNYVVLVDTTTLGIGNLHITLIAHIPDQDFDGALRREVVCVPTNINIVNCI